MALSEKRYMRGEKRANRKTEILESSFIYYLFRKLVMFTYVLGTEIEAVRSGVNMVKIKSER